MKRMTVEEAETRIHRIMNYRYLRGEPGEDDTEIVIQVYGPDAEEAAKTLQRFIHTLNHKRNTAGKKSVWYDLTFEKKKTAAAATAAEDGESEA